MNLKYIGEAVALIGIAWAIMRWVVRTAADVGAPPITGSGDSNGRDRWSDRRDPDDTSGT
jgi:hypothetical protein